jgi:hypothetical protein
MLLFEEEELSEVDRENLRRKKENLKAFKSELVY